MKRFVLFVFIIATLVLSACGGPAATTAPPAAEPTKAEQAQPTAGEAIQLTFMAWGDPQELAVWQAIADDFNKTNPKITVKMDVSDWDSYWTKLNTLFAGKTPPDVFAMDAPLFLDWQSRGVLLNLQPYVDDSPGFLDSLYPQPLEGYKLPDGYYGLPRDFQTIVMFYNKDMFDEAGVSYPKPEWTMNEFREIAKKLTKDKNGDGKTDQYGFSADLWDMELFWSEAIWGFGGDIINADRTKTLVGEPQAREAWHFIHDMMFTDKSMPDTIAAGEYGYDLFQAGVVAMWPMGHWAVPGYSEVKFKWDVAPMPKGPVSQATSVNSAGFVVAKDTKYPGAAWMFVKFALSPEGQTRLTELGLAIPMQKAIAESPTFLERKVGDMAINQKIFLDSLAFARVKPIFKGYTLWGSAVGDGMASIWTGEAELDPTLDEAVKAADAVLVEQK
ncbi:MAG: sugar ABC transporter substrate-binding protein [Anaerolineales bacterium]|nr:sugar ABC transporter substrate-binding protein [Anaerolineales bacterium]